MRLGNSNNNSNKKFRERKYLTKNQKEVIEIKFQKEADEFKIWFGVNYINIIEECKRKNILNEDIINDTFIKLYELQQYKGCIKDFRSYYFRSYFTNFFQNNMKEKKQMETHSSMNLISKWENSDATHTMLTPLNDKMIDTTEFDKEEKNETNLNNRLKIKKILDYIYSNYPLVQFELYKIYTHCQPKLSYKKLSEITNIKINYIAESIKRIKKDVNKNKYIIFSEKYDNTNNITTNYN